MPSYHILKHGIFYAVLVELPDLDISNFITLIVLDGGDWLVTPTQYEAMPIHTRLGGIRVEFTPILTSLYAGVFQHNRWLATKPAVITFSYSDICHYRTSVSSPLTLTTALVSC